MPWSADQFEPTMTLPNGRIMWIRVGSPNLFCFSDGEYLGTETSMDAARRRCVRGERSPVVTEPMTTEEEYKSLKPKPPKLVWTASDKDTWTTTIEGERVPARIRMLDKGTWPVYRDGKYLGSEESRPLAEMRAAINKTSDRHRVMRLWEKKHPEELPPYLAMTDDERKLYWERHPPVKRTSAIAAAKAAALAEDPKTRAMREALAAEGTGGRAGRAKVAKAMGESPIAVPDGIIRVIKAENPKKAGTGAFLRWQALFAAAGKTVKEYAEAGGNLTTLENAVKKGNVSVEK